MSESPSYVSQPQVTDLVKLLSDVRAGHIQVPRFQRPFVWDDDRRLELMRSLRAGIPIGSLLVWRTSQNRANRDHLAHGGCATTGCGPVYLRASRASSQASTPGKPT